MSLSLLFWVLMVLWFFSWGATRWGGPQWAWGVHASNLLFFVLLFVLGWKVFGFVIHE